MKNVTTLILFVILMISFSYSQEMGNSSGFDSIYVNNIKMWFNNHGIDAHSPDDEAGLLWKAGSRFFPVIFADNPVWGAKIDGQIRATGRFWKKNLSPGGIETGIENDTLIWKISENSMTNWPLDIGAPWVDINNDHLYTQNYDRPLLLGNETNWYLMTDADTTINRKSYECDPMGIEIQVLNFAYRYPQELTNTVFKRYVLINKKNNEIEDFYFGYFSDPDLGYATDDFTGCDTLLDLAYVYNSGTNDNRANALGIVCPAAGYTFLNKKMTSFILYEDATPLGHPVSGAYEGAGQLYSNLQGKTYGGLPFINPITGKAETKILAGDPVLKTGWFEGEGWPRGPFAGDKTFLMSSGPYNLKSGDSLIIDMAVMVAQGNDYLDSITELKKSCLYVRDYYEQHISKQLNTNKLQIIPKRFVLYQNYPNPFNNTTSIEYYMADWMDVEILLFNSLGQNVRAITSKLQIPGLHRVTFDASGLASGVYYYRLQAGDFVQTRKMLLLR